MESAAIHVEINALLLALGTMPGRLWNLYVPQTPGRGITRRLS